jgi:hypothetical protein
MNKLVKEFFLRGLVFSGMGPIIYAVVMLMLYFNGIDTNINGLELFIGVASTYLMVFVIAGVSIIWQIEKIGLAVAIPTHGGILYVSYLLTYIINGWIEINFISLLVFSLIFILGYISIWAVIYLTEKNKAKNLNEKLKSNR